MIVQKSLPSRRLFLNGIGVVILLIGINVSGFLYLRSPENTETLDAQNSIVLQEDSRIYQRTVAMYAGTFGLLADEWTRDLESLGEPIRGACVLPCSHTTDRPALTHQLSA